MSFSVFTFSFFIFHLFTSIFTFFILVYYISFFDNSYVFLLLTFFFLPSSSRFSSYSISLNLFSPLPYLSLSFSFLFLLSAFSLFQSPRLFFINSCLLIFLKTNFFLVYISLLSFFPVCFLPYSMALCFLVINLLFP